MSNVTNEFIYQHLQEQLELFKDVKNPKWVICFSGVPGSGKTTIARELEMRLRAIRISNDDIRTVLENHDVTDRDIREQRKEEFLNWLLKRVVDWPNGLLILDSGIDRRFEAVSKYFKNYGYGIYVISLLAPRSVIEDRVMNRKGHRAQPERMIQTMHRWIEDKKKFDTRFKSELDIEVDTTKPVDMAKIETVFRKKANL